MLNTGSMQTVFIFAERIAWVARIHSSNKVFAWHSSYKGFAWHKGLEFFQLKSIMIWTLGEGNILNGIGLCFMHMTLKYLEDNMLECIISWLYIPYQCISHFFVLLHAFFPWSCRPVRDWFFWSTICSQRDKLATASFGLSTFWNSLDSCKWQFINCYCSLESSDEMIGLNWLEKYLKIHSLPQADSSPGFLKGHFLHW